MRLNGLGELQREMRDAIVLDREPPALTGNPRGLEVYRIAFRARLCQALLTNYPVLHRVLGDDGFADWADAYLDAHPSHFRSIRWFGDCLPAFLASRSEELPHPSLPDLARMEWAICSAFDGPDAALLTAAELAALSPESWPGLRLALHPTCTLLDLAWAVAPVWRELAEREGEGAEVAPPEPLAHAIRIWRQGVQPRWRTIDPLEAELLHSIQRGESFESLCALAGEAVGEESAAATVLQHIHAWLGDELLVQPEPAADR